MKKRFLSIVLTLAMVITLMPGMTLSAAAAGGGTVWTASECEFCPAGGGANAKLVLTGVTSSDWNVPPESITIDLGTEFTNIESFEEAYGEDSYTLSMEPIDGEEEGYVEESCFSFRVVNEQHIISEMEVLYNDGTDKCVTLKYSVPEEPTIPTLDEVIAFVNGKYFVNEDNGYLLNPYTDDINFTSSVDGISDNDNILEYSYDKSLLCVKTCDNGYDFVIKEGDDNKPYFYIKMENGEVSKVGVNDYNNDVIIDFVPANTTKTSTQLFTELARKKYSCEFEEGSDKYTFTFEENEEGTAIDINIGLDITVSSFDTVITLTDGTVLCPYYISDIDTGVIFVFGYEENKITSVSFLGFTLEQEKAAHTTHDEIEFQPWVPADHEGALLPNVAGSWYLTEDVTLSEKWTVPLGTTNLCLNGCTITQTSYQNGVIEIYQNATQNATLNLYDCDETEHFGHIDGTSHLWVPDETAGEHNISIFGGCLTGGTGTQNLSNNYGGGVFVKWGTFNMYGGNIVGNTSENGGGVFVHPTDGTFTMTGGAIIGNTATDASWSAGGVYVGGDNVIVGGTAKITDNFKVTGEGAVADNLYVLTTPINRKIALGEGTGSGKNGVAVPTSKMQIGVTTATVPQAGTPVIFTSNGTADDIKYFTSDNDAYDVEYNASGCLQLVIPQAEDYYPVWIGGTQISRFNKDDVLRDGGSVSFDPDTNTLTLNNTTIGTDAESSLRKAIESKLPVGETLTVKLIGTNVIGRAPDEEYEEYTVNTGLYIDKTSMAKKANPDGSLLLIGDENSSLTINAGENGIEGGDIRFGEDGENGKKFEGELKIFSQSEAIKSHKSVFANGGNIFMESQDEGISAEQNVAVSGGKLTIRAERRGIEAKKDVTLSGGEILVIAEGEGVHAKNGVTLSGVTLDVTGGEDECAIFADGRFSITDTDCQIIARGSHPDYGAIYSGSAPSFAAGLTMLGSTDKNAAKENITATAQMVASEEEYPYGAYIGTEPAKAVTFKLVRLELSNHAKMLLERAIEWTGETQEEAIDAVSYYLAYPSRYDYLLDEDYYEHLSSDTISEEDIQNVNTLFYVAFLNTDFCLNGFAAVQNAGFDQLKGTINELPPVAYKLLDLFDAVAAEDYANVVVLATEVGEDGFALYAKVFKEDSMDEPEEVTEADFLTALKTYLTDTTISDDLFHNTKNASEQYAVYIAKLCGITDSEEINKFKQFADDWAKDEANRYMLNYYGSLLTEEEFSDLPEKEKQDYIHRTVVGTCLSFFDTFMENHFAKHGEHFSYEISVNSSFVDILRDRLDVMVAHKESMINLIDALSEPDADEKYPLVYGYTGEFVNALSSDQYDHDTKILYTDWDNLYLAMQGEDVVTSAFEVTGSGSNREIKLLKDINCAELGIHGEALSVEEEKSIVLDLNGHKLDRNLKAATEKGSVIIVNNGASLTVQDGSAGKTGKITGGNAVNGGGVNVAGTFNMFGGTITGNTASQFGGGVYENGTMTLGGTAQITGNTLADNVTASNLYLPANKTVTLGTGTDAPVTTGDKTMSVGVTTKTAPTAGSSVAITGSNGSSNYSGCFTSDIGDFGVFNDKSTENAQVVKLRAHEHDWSFEANDATITATCKDTLGTCSVNEKKVTLTLTKNAAENYYVYDGRAKTVDFATDEAAAWKAAVGSEAPTIIYTAKEGSALTEGEAVNAGNYTATVTVDTDKTAMLDFTIAKAALTATASSHTVAYGATAPTYTVSYTGWLKGEETPTTAAALTSEYTTTSNVGEYAVTFETTPVFANYTVTTKNGKVTVERAKTAVEPTVADGLVYTGNPQNGYTDAGTHVTLGGTSSATDAAESYSFTATPDVNYAWSDGSTEAKTYTWSIVKATAEITVDQTAIVKTFGEAVVLPTATSSFGEVACDKTAEDLVNVGSYTVTYTVAGTANYDGDTKTVSVTINQLAVNEPSVTGTYTYTGKEQTATVTGKADYMTETGDVKGTDAGSYTITYTLDGNHCWADGSDGTVTWSIGKADMVVGTNILAPSVPVSELVYDGSAKELLCAGQTWDEKDGTTSFGTFYYSVDGKSWSTDLPTAINAGKYNPVWYFVGDGNHNNIGSAEEPTSQPDPVEILKTGPANAPSVTASDVTATEDTVTLPYEATYEYQMDNGEWQSGEGKNIFTGLDPETQHTFKVRMKETETAMPSNEATITVYTAAATPANVAATGTVSYENETFEPKDDYEISETDAPSFSAMTLTGGKAALQPNKTYYIRKAASGSVPASATVSLTIPTRPTTPSTPELVSKTDTTVTVTAVNGQEYSIDNGTTWVSDGGTGDGDSVTGKITFTGLTQNKAYSVITRVKAVTTAGSESFASESSTALSVTTKTSAANAPSITPTITATSVVLPASVNPNIYEYSTDGTDWNDTRVFAGLEAATQYTYYVRVKETATAMPSQTATVTIYTNQSAPKKGDGYSINSYNEKGQPVISITSGYEVSTSPDFGTKISNGTALTVGETYYVRKAAVQGGAGASAGTAFVATEQPKVTVSATSSNNGGTVKVEGVTNGVCFVGTSVKLTATPKAGYKFDGWYDGETQKSTENPYTFAANEAAILTARFVVDKDKVETAPISTARVYDGETTTLETLKGGHHYTLTCDSGTIQNAGTYKLTAKLENGYVWEDGSTVDKTFFYTVNKAANSAGLPSVAGDNENKGITGFYGENMEWRKSDADEYTSDAPENLDYGTYYVRMKGNTNTEPGKDVVIVLRSPVTTKAPTDITATTAMLNGAATDGTSPVTYQYRKVGSNDWLTSDGNLTGLSPDTEYEFRAVIGEAKGEVMTFRTERQQKPQGKIQTQIKGNTGTEVTVTVEQGNTVLSTQKITLESGTKNFQIENLADGYYNLVVSTNDYTETRLLEIKNGQAVAAKFEIPAGTLSSVVEVKKDTPKVAVDGLADVITEADANAAAAGSKSVEVKLEVEKKPETNVEGGDQIKVLAGNQVVDTFLDMSLFKTTTEINGDNKTTTRENIGSDENNPVLEIVVPFNTNRNGLQIYHYHNGVAKKLAKLSERPTGSFTDGTYYIGDGYLFVYTKQFSTYAIGYEEEQDDPYIPYIPVTPSYSITGADTENGKLTVNKKTASAGQTVTITVTPDEGYKLDTLTAKDAKGNVLTLTKASDTTYTFKMPSSTVTISAMFAKIGTCPQDATCVYAKFTDADTKAWYHDGVHFCVENSYMQGVSTTAFDPSGTTTRAMIVTMLWRMEGKPVANYAMSFKDVKADQWYTEAIRWAQSTGVVEGYSAEAFGPDDPITREQMATILYRYAKYHEIDVANANTLAGFTDVNKVSAWALDAMKWANAVGLVQGRTTTTLVPEVSITRAEAATMVQRYCEKNK